MNVKIYRVHYPYLYVSSENVAYEVINLIARDVVLNKVDIFQKGDYLKSVLYILIYKISFYVTLKLKNSARPWPCRVIKK